MPQQKLKTLKDFDFENKRVFMRVDFNVPLHNQAVQDSRRIDKALPSIEWIMERGGKIVLASHLGRPQGKRDLKLSLNPAAEYLSGKKNLEVFFVEEYGGLLTQKLLKGLKKGQVILLENLRFHKGEEALDPHFAKELAGGMDIYINEAFGISHREHASIVLLPELIAEKGLGLQFEKEIEMLNLFLSGELKKPFCVVLGGSKIKDKIPLMDSLIDQADEFLIGGLTACAFLKAKGFHIGQTPLEEQSFKQAQSLIERLEGRGKKIFLPVDFKGELNTSVLLSQKKPSFRQSPSFPGKRESITWTLEKFPSSAVAYDIGEKSLKLFQDRIKKAGAVFWNGPMGFFEEEDYASGTLGLAQALVKNKTAYRVAGGGHSALAVRDFESEIDHISTGGGASLAYLQDKTLIGLKKLYSIS